MNRNESERPELHDFEVGKACIFEALQKGQPDLVVDLLVNGHDALKLLTQHLFRMALKNGDLSMIQALLPFGKWRDSEVRISILESAVKTNNAEIVGIVYDGLEISPNALKPKLLKSIQEFLPEVNASIEKSEISPSSFADLTKRGVLLPINHVELTAEVVEAVVETRDDELIYQLAREITKEGIKKEHAPLLPWLKKNWPDPEFASQMDDLVKDDTEQE